MRISRIRIENFRSFKDITIPIGKYSCLIGANGTGKSTILCALGIFFRDTANMPTDVLSLDEEDFHHKNTKLPVRITVTFTDLSSQAQSDLADYYRHGELTICAKAEFDEREKLAVVKQYGLRLGLEDFRTFFEQEKQGAKVADLKLIYESFMKKYADLPKPSTKTQMVESMHKYESDHIDQCVQIESTDQFYGFTKGISRLEPYVQWICVPAVKDVLTEQAEGKNTYLGRILQRTVRAKVDFTEAIGRLRSEAIAGYESMLEDNRAALMELSGELETKLRQWSHPETTLALVWGRDPNKSVTIQDPSAEILPGEGIFQGKLARFGHGLQRSYLFALLHVLSKCDDSASPTLIFGCEEPELFQHPPQLRHLANVFRELSEKNSQIMLCTHSPYFISAESFEEIRLLRKNLRSCESTVTCTTLAQVADMLSKGYPGNPPMGPSGMLLKINSSLQPELNEMFFANTAILVEGYEDQAYITAYTHLLGYWTEFRRLGCYVVPAGGKSHLVKPLAVAKALGIPCFVVFDADGHIPSERSSDRIKHEKDNRALLSLLNAAKQPAFPDADTLGENFAMWKSEFGAVIEEELRSEEYSRILTETRNKYGNPKNINKNPIFIADVLETAWGQGHKSSSLTKLCENILTYATACRC